MSDTGLFLATSIVLFSTGHWIGGSVALVVAIFAELV
jgi:hypothetical protein